MARDPITLAEKWKSNVDFELSGFHFSDWENYIVELNKVWVTLHPNSEDARLWMGGDTTGDLNVKNVYDSILSTQVLPICQGWRVQLWKWKMQLKVILFFWLAVQNKILTWDILQLKGWVGPSLCTLCKQNAKEKSHLFIECTFAKSVWAKCAYILNIKFKWASMSLMDCMNSWTLNKHLSKRLSVLTCWYIWKECNKSYLMVDHLRPGQLCSKW
jgi:hypothetical protein